MKKILDIFVSSLLPGHIKITFIGVTNHSFESFPAAGFSVLCMIYIKTQFCGPIGRNTKSPKV